MKTLNCIGGETGKIEFQNVRGDLPNLKVTVQGITKVIAIHCVKCGILVGYRRYDVDILCVNCGQTLLSEVVK